MSTENPPGDTGVIIEKLSRLEASVEDLQNKVDQVTGDVRALRGDKVSVTITVYDPMCFLTALAMGSKVRNRDHYIYMLGNVVLIHSFTNAVYKLSQFY